MTDSPVASPGGSTASATAPDDGHRLSNSLGVTSIVFMVVAAAAPLTVVGGVMPLGFSIGNGLGFPVMFLVAAFILTLFSVGLSQMARVVPKPGAFYTYIREGLGHATGTASAFVAVAAYVCAPICTSTYVGVQISLAVHALGGPAVPWWVYSAVVIALIAWLGYNNIDLTARVLGVLLVGEVVVVVILSAVVFATGGASGFTPAPLEPSSIFSGNIGIAIMFAVTGFMGFEATAVYRDEARNPSTTVPRATYISVIGVGVFYAIAGYALVVAWGPGSVIAESLKDPAGMLVSTAGHYLGVPGEIAAQTLLITSVLAGYLAFHNVAARYMHSMAGHGMLSARLNAVHSRHGSPHRSSLIMSATTAVIVAVCAVIGLDPVNQVFAWFSTLSTTGIMILMILTGIAVPVYFRRAGALGNRWATVVAPILGTAGLVVAAVLLFQNFPMLVGGSPALAYSLLAIFPAAVIVGLIVAARVRRRRVAGLD
jgi:amino acid transporter